MSLFAIIVSVLHAVPIVITLWVTNRRTPVLIAALVMAVVAVLTGHSGYTLLDLLVVTIAYFACIETIEEKEKGLGKY